MRHDMFKVIVEKPRLGSRVRWSTGTRRLLASEDAPVKLGMRAGRGGKWSRDHLGPLRNFLLRQVGRPWNAVFSEICAVVDRRSTVQQHVLLHIGDFVVLETKLVDGEVCGPSHRSVFTPLRDLPEELYVHPETGVLLRNNARLLHRQKQRAQAKHRQAEIEARRRDLSPTEQLHRIDGHWYFVRLAEIPERIGTSRWDHVRKDLVFGGQWYEEEDLYGRPGVYAAAKRQLSAHELRRYGLK
jgi:hypothetical protein